MVNKELLKDGINSFCAAFDFNDFKPFRSTNRFIDKLTNHYDCLQFSEIAFENKPRGLSISDECLHDQYIINMNTRFKIIDPVKLYECSEAYSRVEKIYKDFESERVRYESGVYSEYWDDEGLDYMNPFISFIKYYAFFNKNHLFCNRFITFSNGYCNVLQHLSISTNL